jgi:Zn ribbon nucleic-acid-binding protein
MIWNRPEKTKDLYDIVNAKCPQCGKIKKMSFGKGENIRLTYCHECGEAVVWYRVEE